MMHVTDKFQLEIGEIVVAPPVLHRLIWRERRNPQTACGISPAFYVPFAAYNEPSEITCAACAGG